MKREEFADILGEIEEKYTQEALTVKRGKRPIWFKAGIAACAALAVLAGAYLNRPAEKPALPKLTVSEDAGGGMGFEGYMAQDISQLTNANPWSESRDISALPVFRNRVKADNYLTSRENKEKMRRVLTRAAESLGLNRESLVIEDNSPSPEEIEIIMGKFKDAGAAPPPEGFFEPTRLIAKAEGVQIEVDESFTVTVRFDPAVELPRQYNFTHFAGYEDALAVTEYLKEVYRDFINMRDAQINLHGGDLNIYGNQSYSISFFEGDCGEIDKIINYNFNCVTFACDDEGKLFIARIFQPDLSDKVGDYPIITAKEAEELLCRGHYATSVPREMPGAEYIRKVELVYRDGRREDYFMPYYRFYVELPEMERDNGIKTYGAYYVPAVDGDYIENMPTYDGSFN